MGKIEDLAAEMKLEMIKADVWREVADTIGLANFLHMLNIIGGATIYVPKLDTVTRPLRDLRIKEEFNGYNYAELARKYNLSERYLRDLIGGGLSEG